MLTNPETPINPSNVERDPRLFIWFLTLVMGIMYVTAILERPVLQQPLQLILFTGLFIIHTFLHWQIVKVIKSKKITLVYILVQGALAFLICLLAEHEVILIGIYIALLGEALGMLGFSRGLLLSVIYYLILAAINYQQAKDIASVGRILSVTIPTMIFTVIYITLYGRQAEARTQAQKLAKELEKANHQLSQYAAQVEDLTITNERQRMARELHDTLSQGLTGIILQLEAVEAHLASNRTEKAKSIIANAMLQARAALADARNAIDDLRSTSSSDLNSALRFEISHFSNATDIHCDFHSDALPALPEPVIEAIIRSVAEALTNIAQHAQAQQVMVNVTIDEQNLVVTIQDDGQGFDAQAIPSGHYGLLGIQERLRLKHGEFSIESKQGIGTTLKMSVPL